MLSETRAFRKRSRRAPKIENSTKKYEMDCVYGRTAARLRQSSRRTSAIKAKPRLRRHKFRVHVVNILDAFVLQPVFQRFRALLRVNRNAFLPSRAPAEPPREIHAGFRGKLKRFGENVVIHARRKINERFLRCRRSLTKMIFGLVARVNRFAFASFRSSHKSHVHRNFYL